MLSRDKKFYSYQDAFEYKQTLQTQGYFHSTIIKKQSHGKNIWYVKRGKSGQPISHKPYTYEHKPQPTTKDYDPRTNPGNLRLTKEQYNARARYLGRPDWMMK